MKGPKARSMEKVWQMFSDRDIYALLAGEEKISEDSLRLLLAELLNRTRRLEQANFALTALLMEEGLFDDDTFRHAVKNAGDYLKHKDVQKSNLTGILKESGITFREWVNFTVNGSFDTTPEAANGDS